MRWSLSKRLFFSSVALISLAVILAGTVLLAQLRRELYRGFEDGTVVLARAIAEHCAAPLVFDDRAGAAQILAKLARSEVVGSAVLYGKDGEAIASYHRPGAVAPAPVARVVPSLVHVGDQLHVFEPIRDQGGIEGSLYLVASTARVRARVLQGTLTVCLAALGAILVAALLAALFQRRITRPILKLADTMRGATGDDLDTMKVAHGRSDELGVLYAGFNLMIEKLGERQRERDRSDGRLRALIAALPDPVFVLDREANVVEALAARPGPVPSGAPTPALRGATAAEVLGPQGAAALAEALPRALQTGSPRRFAYERDEAGSTRWFDAVVVPIEDEAAPDRPLVLVVPRDVTERQTLEIDLRQAQKMEALGRLAGGVAHDFNNILTAILGYAELLGERLGDDPRSGAHEAGEIKLAARRASQLTQQLLAFSRRQVVARSQVSLNRLVTEMQSMLQRIIGEDVTLAADLTPGLPPLSGDAGQLQQVLLNLAVNARDAMPGGGTVTVRTRAFVSAVAERRPGEPELAPGNYVLLEVEDSGVGMDEAVRARIFEPFFTTKHGTSTGGTGLGLAMVYGIVRQSGGDITVTSVPGGGTTFHVYFPADPHPLRAEESPPSPRGSTPGVENGTILLVEDEPQIRALIVLLLRDQRYRVLEAEGAERALELCRTYVGRIDLLLTDVVMPGMGGPALVQALLLVRPDLRVLYMSGYTDSEIVHRGVALHQVPFLQKPFTPAELHAKLAEVLEPLPAPRGAGMPERPTSQR